MRHTTCGLGFRVRALAALLLFAVGLVAGAASVVEALVH
jgi:hypothetical protein